MSYADCRALLGVVLLAAIVPITLLRKGTAVSALEAFYLINENNGDRLEQYNTK